MSETSDFRSIIDAQRNIPGSFLEESAAVWCALLSEQHETWRWHGCSSGDYLEIGVLHGKSASVLANFSRRYENRLTLIDPEIRAPTRQTLDSICERITYIESRSELVGVAELSDLTRRSMAFCHIDGMHRFSAVISDLQLCESLLGDYGILSIDDFHTDLFPQVPAAVYRYLYSGVSDLCIFLVGLNKAYLCRNAAKKHFLNYAGTELLPRLEALGYKLTLAKTDRNDSFDAFAITRFYEQRLFGSDHIVSG